MPEHKKGKKNRKFNRNRVKCAKYANEHRRVTNSAVRAERFANTRVASGQWSRTKANRYIAQHTRKIHTPERTRH